MGNSYLPLQGAITGSESRTRFAADWNRSARNLIEMLPTWQTYDADLREHWGYALEEIMLRRPREDAALCAEGDELLCAHAEEIERVTGVRVLSFIGDW